MPTKRTNYSKIRENKGDLKKPDDQVDTEIKNPEVIMANKKGPESLRIRKGPGYDFKHNGRYVEGVKTLKLAEIQNGWGLLKEYETTRDGWICLDYVELV